MKCLYCDRPVRKHSTRVWVRAEPSEWDRPSKWTRYAYVGANWPNTKGDCQRLSNQEVLAVGRWSDGKVDWFSEWDGQTYLPAARYFCTNVCATRFGRAAAEAGYRMKKRAAQGFTFHSEDPISQG